MDDLINQFTTITAATPAVATQYLRLSGSDLEQAIQLFFANDGADLEPTGRHQPPAVPAPPTRSANREQSYTDEQGVVHLDSDEDNDSNYIGEEEVETTEASPRPPASRRTEATQHQPSRTSPPVEDDEALARRLQEEDYGGLRDEGGGNTLADQGGYRAPIARTTQTLVGPGSFDPSNADEMRAAVRDQLAARRQARLPRGNFHRYS